LAAGGEVIGVIPEALVDLEIAHRGLTELKIVGSMHERKATMAELSDGFAALPGGLGTLEETFEVLTWSQLGFHKKPCGLLNIDGYYDQLLAFLDRCVEEGLLRAPNREKILAEANTEALLERFASYESAESEKWLRRLSEL
ncbi:MAG TPA: TIGR00730 family Rossman fold protein, partial [Hyphomicrobiales bacterium]